MRYLAPARRAPLATREILYRTKVLPDSSISRPKSEHIYFANLGRVKPRSLQLLTRFDQGLKHYEPKSCETALTFSTRSSVKKAAELPIRLRAAHPVAISGYFRVLFAL